MKTINRLIGFTLALTILISSCFSVPAFAAEPAGGNGSKKGLSGISITGLAEPVVGTAFDTVATVTTSQGITWDIPVMWIDAAGNIAKIPETGKKYMPSMIFYIPKDCYIEGMDASGKFSVSFPAFISATYDLSKIVYIYDSSTGIVYIMFSPEVLGRAPSIYPGWDSGNNSSDSEKTVKKESTPQVFVPSQVRIHCDNMAIEILGPEVLSWLVDVIKNRLEPQAVNLLRNSFPCFAESTAGKELGTQIGLYLYYNTGTIDNSPTVPGALALVMGGYSTDMKYRYVLAVDVATLVKQDSTTGKWYFDESSKSTLSNTIVHEMMHAFMDDYNRYGMCGDSSFPNWFVEGTASSVENVYQFRSYMLQSLSDENGRGSFDDNLLRYTGNVLYTQESVRSAYMDDTLEGDYIYDLSNCNSSNNTASAYVAGYLACVYLSKLAAEDIGLTVNNADGSININAIRSGMSSILSRLHGTSDGFYTLDDIVSDISGNRYTDTADFETKFIKGESEDENGDTVYDDSLAFITDYLNYLESQSRPGDNSMLANGSILRQDQQYSNPLDWNLEATSEFYKIIDSSCMTLSTADDNIAYNTGGTSIAAKAGAVSGVSAAAKAGQSNGGSTAADTASQETAEGTGTEDPATVTGETDGTSDTSNTGTASDQAASTTDGATTDATAAAATTTTDATAAAATTTTDATAAAATTTTDAAATTATDAAATTATDAAATTATDAAAATTATTDAAAATTTTASTTTTAATATTAATTTTASTTTTAATATTAATTTTTTDAAATPASSV